VKPIALAIVAIFLFSACGWFGEPEQYKTESGRTTYRSVDQTPSATMTPAPQKIPGESTRR
jgi:hypothetical protein